MRLPDREFDMHYRLVTSLSILCLALLTAACGGGEGGGFGRNFKLYWGIAAGDLNGDTRPDLLAANNASDNVSVLPQDPALTGIFQPAVYFGTGDPEDAAIGDLDDDTPDLAVANDHSLLVLLQSGTPGSFLPAVLVGQ
jgi:FG-GAP repeat